MKYAPQKVFILENGKYKEIPYSELQKLEQSDKSYAEKFFLPLYGMLMEVTEEDYKDYYKDKRRQKYIDECSRKRGDVSYDALDTDETLGAETFEDKSINIEKQVEDNIMISLLNKAIKLLSPEDYKLIQMFFYENYSERTLSKKYGISRPALHKKLQKIFYQIKQFMKN